MGSKINSLVHGGVFGVIGVLLLATQGYLVYTMLPATVETVIISSLPVVGSIGLVVMGWVYISKRQFEGMYRPFVWFVIGVVGMVIVGGGHMIYGYMDITTWEALLSEDIATWEIILSTVHMASLGGFVGAVVGYYNSKNHASVRELENEHDKIKAKEKKVRVYAAKVKEKLNEIESKNKDMEVVASIISHDLQNPLSIADSYLSELKKDIDRDELDEIEQAHERMWDILEETLKFIRDDELVKSESMGELTLSKLVRDSLQNLKLNNDNVTVVDDMGFEGHAESTQHIIENLIKNASEHTKTNVDIRIGTLTNQNGFYIEDDGSGIPNEKTDKIFDLGFTTAESGTGIGLAIVEKICEAHDWDISVTDGGNGGARFEIVID